MNALLFEKAEHVGIHGKKVVDHSEILHAVFETNFVFDILSNLVADEQKGGWRSYPNISMT